MQVRVRTNFAPSVPYVDRSRAAAGASAVYGERLRDIVSYAVVGYRTILYHIGDGTIRSVSLTVIRHIDVPFAVSGNSNDRP